MSFENDTCANQLNGTDLETVLIIRGLSGGISFVLSVMSVVVFLLFRWKRPDYLPEVTISERILIFTAGMGIFRSICVMLQTSIIDYRNDDPLEYGLCQATGFLNIWSVSSADLSILMILLLLLIQLSLKDGVEISGRIPLQFFYVLFPLLFPLLYSWIPFVYHNGYGLVGGWCWVRTQKENCETDLELYLSWMLPSFVVQFIIVIGLFVLYPVFLCRRIPSRRQRIQLFKMHSPLLTLVLVLTLLFLPLIDHSANMSVVSRWSLHAVFSSSVGFFTALTIFIYLACLVRLQVNDKDNSRATDHESPLLVNV